MPNKFLGDHSGMLNWSNLIALNSLDERAVAGFAAAERVAVNRATLGSAVADAGAVCECFGLGVEALRLVEIDCIVGVEIFFEALDVIILGEVDKNWVCQDVNFYCHIGGEIWNLGCEFGEFNRKLFQSEAESPQFFGGERNRLAVDNIVVQTLSEPGARAVEIPLGDVGAVDAVKHFCAKYLPDIDYIAHLLITLDMQS